MKFFSILYSSAVFAILAAVAFGQDPAPAPPPEPAAKIAAPEFMPAGKMVRVSIENAPKEAVFVWDVLPYGTVDLDIEGEGYGVAKFTALASKDPYLVRCWIVINGSQLELSPAKVMIGEKPIPPIPPAPNPIPTPPNPTPTPSKIRVLALYDERAASPELVAAINSVEVRAYLDSHCFTGADGRPEYRFWDDDYSDEQILGPHGQKWLDAYTLVKKERAAKGLKDDDAYLLISNGTDGESLTTPIPAGKLLEQLKKWGGN